MDSPVPLLTREVAQAYEKEFVTGLSVKTLVPFTLGLHAIAEGRAIVIPAQQAEGLREGAVPPVGVPEPLVWESTTVYYKSFLTDAEYQKLHPDFKKWYRPVCQKCAAPIDPPALMVDRAQLEAEILTLRISAAKTVNGRRWNQAIEAAAAMVARNERKEGE